MSEIYNYREHVTKDVITYLKEYHLDPSQGWLDDLMDKVSEADEITGMGSGSYTMNTVQAEENLVGNLGLLQVAVERLNPDFDLLKEGPEKADSLIRSYLAPLVVLRMTY